jgi:hypothetical protein
MTQPSLFDAPERAKQQAIAQVEANNREFVEMVYTFLEFLARRRPTITAIDLWDFIDCHEPGFVPKPKHPRAMGVVFVRARNAGLISPTNSWVKSGRTSDHNQMLRVWASNVYQR